MSNGPVDFDTVLGPAPERLPTDFVMYAVYQNPSDYPGKFVVREIIARTGTLYLVDPPTAVTGSLLLARSLGVPRGYHRIARSIDDDPVVVETWV